MNDKFKIDIDGIEKRRDELFRTPILFGLGFAALIVIACAIDIVRTLL